MIYYNGLKKTNNTNIRKIRVAMFVISTVGLFISIWLHPVVVLLLLLHVLYIMLSDEKECLFLLFFLLPFATIYKIAPNTISFFTILEVFAVAWCIMRRRKFQITALIGILWVTAILLLAPNRNVVDMIRVLLTLIVISLFLSCNENWTREVVFSFALGLLISSLIALFRNQIPNLQLYIQNVESFTSLGYASRFTGLYTDPNYYSVNIMTCNFALLALYYNRKIGGVFWAITVALAFFGALTMSKSLIVMLFVYYLVLIGTLVKGRRRVVAFFSVLFLGIFAMVILYSENDFFVLFRARFNFDSVDDLTTGRLTMLMSYLKHIVSEPGVFLRGEGIGGELLCINGKYRASHNLYIDLVYYLGLLGAGIYVLTISVIWKENRCTIKRGLHHYATLICTLVMYFFLSAFLMIEMPFLLLLGFYIHNEAETSKSYVQ